MDIDKKTLGIVSGIAIVAATTGTLLFAPKNDVTPLPPEVPVIEQPAEAETVGTVIKLANGKFLHIFGVYNEKKAAVVDTIHGRAAVLNNITGDVTCNLLLDAKVIAASQKTITKTIGGKPVVVTVTERELPDIPKLAKAFGIVSWPVRVSESCDVSGKCLWEVLLRGSACKIAGEDVSFVASSPKEFATLSNGIKDRAKTLSSWFDKD